MTDRAVDRAVAAACADVLVAARTELHPTAEQLARLEARVQPIAAELAAQIHALTTPRKEPQP